MSEHTQLWRRLVSSAVFVGVAAYGVFLSPPWFFVVLVELFVVLGLLEYFSLAERKGYFINRYIGLFFGMLLPLSTYYPGEAVIFTLATLCLFVFNFHKDLKDQAIVGTALTLFGLIYVAWFFSFLIKIRSLPNGFWWVFFIISVIKVGDAAAYFIGKAFGTHKFITHISPNKSIEGAVAHFVASLACALLSKVYLPDVPFYDLAILGIIYGIVSQLGDLSESLLKRDAGIKDSGNIPGLGGVLDVIDSLLFCIPITYYYLVTHLKFY